MQDKLYSVKYEGVEYTIELAPQRNSSIFYKIIRYGNTRMMLAGSKSYNKLRKQLDQLMIDLKTNPHAWSAM